jgi:HNH endonuclease
MWRDLDAAAWPKASHLLAHKLVAKLLGEDEPTDAEPPIVSEEESIDHHIDIASSIHVVDADSSQALCIEEAQRGRNLVIQGPPGTGKSQTIANIIAAGVREGKSVGTRGDAGRGRLRGLHIEEVIRYLYGESRLADDLVETAVRLEALEDWTAVVQEERAVYRVNRLTRDAAFRDVVLANYGYTCAVTGLRFRRGAYVEAEAAHIIGKEARGPDDPRNGLALSRTAHWAFDHGIFTLSDDYEVTIHDRARDGDQRFGASLAHYPIGGSERAHSTILPPRYFKIHYTASQLLSQSW